MHLRAQCELCHKQNTRTSLQNHLVWNKTIHWLFWFSFIRTLSHQGQNDYETRWARERENTKTKGGVIDEKGVRWSVAAVGRSAFYLEAEYLKSGDCTESWKPLQYFITAAQAGHQKVRISTLFRSLTASNATSDECGWGVRYPNYTLSHRLSV